MAGVSATIVLTVVGAMLMAVAISSTSRLPWLGWLALVPLLRVIQVHRAGVAFLCGLIWAGSVLVFSGLLAGRPLVSDPARVLAFCLLPGLYSYAGARLTRMVGFHPLVVAVGWMVVEAAMRPLGLHHGMLAVTQGDGWLVRVVGHFFGYVLVAFVLALSSAAFLAMLSGLRFRLPRFRQMGFAVPTGSFVLHPVERFACLIPVSPSQPRAPPFVG